MRSQQSNNVSGRRKCRLFCALLLSSPLRSKSFASADTSNNNNNNNNNNIGRAHRRGSSTQFSLHGASMSDMDSSSLGEVAATSQISNLHENASNGATLAEHGKKRHRAFVSETALSATAASSTASSAPKDSATRSSTARSTTATTPSIHNRTDEFLTAQKPSDKKDGPLKVLFLSADTGGGHRASAESLANQFLRHFPGTTYDLLDVWTPTGTFPYRTLVPAYKYLSAHPGQWRLIYYISNFRPYELFTDLHTRITCLRKIRRFIEPYNADVIVSVHPAMNYVPLIATRQIGKKKGKYIPFFTVVTDFGSGHTTWFQKKVDKLFVASERLRKLAKKRGHIPDENLIMSGLPIRHDFAIQTENMGDRTTDSGKEYQKAIRTQLGIDPDKTMILVMGGGEGVGFLSHIVNSLYRTLWTQGIDATICVVCGRNEKLRKELATRNWTELTKQTGKRRKKRHILMSLFFRRSKRIQAVLDRAEKNTAEEGTNACSPGKVDVIGLGFVTRMAEHMVAADILVSKAGPGTIAEAAALGLPVMITSFLPGQEAGNVNIVLDGEFGDFCDEPDEIAREISLWLKDSSLLDHMSRKSAAVGLPNAASDIVKEIGEITHSWMEKNKDTPTP